ncbi:MAG TPA: hypothetical protein VKO84_01390 [Gaiellaceae bacterium]|nr:hypothetical protein [Gaiellaceae bacterium]
MIALVFSYEVHDAPEFERVYGSAGEWAEFFRQGRGYIGTELLRDVEGWAGSVAGNAGDARPEDRAPSTRGGRYLVIDRWESAEAYNAFAAEHREEYMERVDATRFRYDSELRFGTFETIQA